MLFSDTYFTVAKEGETQFKDRGSKFLAYIFPVKSEAEIKERLLQLRKHHPSARRLGADKLAYRSNDDGEPSNSAGKPILGQIQANDLTDVLIVVVRYFGGTLLGVSGLINAYRSSAAQAITAAGITEKFITYEYEVEFATDDTNNVMRILNEFGAKIVSHDFVESNRVIFHAKKSVSEALEDKFHDLYATRLKFLNTVK